MFTRFLCGVAFAALSMSAAPAENLPTVLIRGLSTIRVKS